VVDAWESVAEMERGLAMPEGSLQKTLRDYNEHARRGEDPEFHKKGKWVTPIEQPPFAAIQFSRGKCAYMGFTLGGLRVSVDGEVPAQRRQARSRVCTPRARAPRTSRRTARAIRAAPASASRASSGGARAGTRQGASDGLRNQRQAARGLRDRSR
jgi:hypothetical protein